MMTAKRNISGARTAMRMHIMNAICTLLTSVVMRVTSEAEENLSIFSKAKPCTRVKTSWRTFLANPALAREPNRPPSAPQPSDTRDIRMSTRPTRTTPPSAAPFLISLTRLAVKNGISTSIATSPTMHRSVRTVGFLYSRIQPMKWRIIFIGICLLSCAAGDIRAFSPARSCACAARQTYREWCAAPHRTDQVPPYRAARRIRGTPPRPFQRRRRCIRPPSPWRADG